MGVFAGVGSIVYWISVCLLLLQGTQAWASPFDDVNDLFAKRPCQQSVYRLQYASVNTVRHALEKSKLLSKPHTWMYWDERQNSIFYCVFKREKQQLRGLLRLLDKPVKQIKVGVKIVSVDEDWLESLGLRWDFHGSQTDSSNAFVLLQSNLGLKILSQLSAKTEKDHAEVVASPTLVTSNNQSAFIESGDKIPYQERNHEGDLSTVFKEASLRLSITPTILPKQAIHLKINLHYDKVSEFSVAGMPVIRAQQLQTDIVAHVGHMVVLGGIIEDRHEKTHEGVPLLSKIPVLGWLFRYRQQSIGRKQLLVFLYPEVVG